MFKVALRGLLSRRLRLALTGLAVALGVTLIAGTYVYTDTINRSFDRIFAASFQGSDVVVTGKEAVETEDGQTPPLDGALVDRVEAVEGVSQVEGSLFDQNAAILDPDGERIGNSQAPQFVASTGTAEQFEAFDYVAGRKPSAPGEVALDKRSAEKAGYRLGDLVSVQGAGPRRELRLVGLAEIAGVASFGGATVALMPLAEAQAVVGKTGQVDQILATVEEGVDADATVAEIQRVLGGDVVVRTGADEAASASEDNREDFSFLNTALLAFAGISLFVGAFLIFNTFSITVAQRAREFALLRTLGAKRGQVLRSVLAEGLTIGALGSLVGLGLGVLTAKGLQALFKAVGFELPSTGTVIETRTIVVSLVVGVVVTLVACLAPALRATRVAPVAALREGAVIETAKRSRLAAPLSVLLTVGGFALILVGLLAGLEEGPALSFVGGGAAAAFLGTALFSPRLVRPLAGVIGRPIERRFGLPGRLARENTTRLPGRTAVTSAALMIGVALVTFASIFAASAAKTLGGDIEEKLKGDLVVQHTDGFSSFTPQAVQAAARVPGVTGATTFRNTQGAIAGDDEEERSFTGIDPEAFTGFYDFGGDALRGLGPGEVAVADDLAEEKGWREGTQLTVTTPSRKTVRLRVAGLFESGDVLVNSLVTTEDTLERDFGLPRITAGFLAVDGDAAQARERVGEVLERDFPQAEAFTAKEWQEDNEAQLTQLLGLIYALLSLSIVVSLFGIVNTLVLSITERTRELGLLRAIGTSRRQVKRIVRYESVITALIGGVIGSVLGVILATLVAQPLEDFEFTIPVVSILVTLVLAGVAGVMAAALPARRAAKLDVLEALAYE